MPLRVAVRKDTGTLWITGTIRPAGSDERFRIRQRAGSDDEAVAREEAAAIERDIIRNHHLGERPVQRGFAAAVISYMEHQRRSEATKALVNRLVRHFANAPLRSINQESLDGAVKALTKPNAASGTIRRNVIVPLRAIMLHAARRGWCDMPVFDLPAEPKGRTAFLMPDQAEALIEAATPHVRPLLAFLFCTGCRMGEALALRWDQVDLRAARVILWEGETKSGARRVVGLPPRAVSILGGLPAREGHVFLSRTGEPYRQTDAGGGGQLRAAWATASRDAGLPGVAGERARADRRSMVATFRPDMSPHTTRHTWATWHYALHRDLVKLKQDGGWSSVTLVERYAHLMPAGCEDAIRRVWGLAGPIVVKEMRA